MNRGTQYQLSEQYGTKKMILRHSTTVRGEKENNPPTPKLNVSASSFVPIGAQKSKSIGEIKNLVEQKPFECVARRGEKMKKLGLERPDTVKLESRPDTVKLESRALATPSLEQQVQIESMILLMKKIMNSPEQLGTVAAQMNQV